MISRKDKIYDYVKLHTKEMIDTHSLENSGSDALSIALDLKLDRTNVSRELNTLWKEGRLIKLQGPVPRRVCWTRPTRALFTLMVYISYHPSPSIWSSTF